jgi:hypothetical protein
MAKDSTSNNLKPESPAKRKVVWTAEAEACLAHSEHGTHKAGDVVDTIYADLFIKREWVKEVSK